MNATRTTTTTTRRTSKLRAFGLTATTALLLTTAACSDDTKDAAERDIKTAVTDVSTAADEASKDAVEIAARNIASAQGSQQFEAAGHPINGELTCQASATDGLTAVKIDCTGTTADGESAVLTGSTTEFPGASFDELDGDFAGTVDGTEVFRTDRLGA